MLSTTDDKTSHALAIANEQALKKFASDIAVALEPGDVVTLSGELGTGKTTFARALIRALAGDESLEVPSPTFTLVQSYDLPRFPLIHVDLYRLAHSAELAELGWQDLPKNAVVLVEWPERADGALPPDRFDVAFALAPQRGAEQRDVTLAGHGACAARAERIMRVRRFLDAGRFAQAARRRIQGDASTRVYERLTQAHQRAILMISPRRPDGPPVRDGKPYSAIAHLAEDVRPFVALANGLRARGLSAPEILAADLDAGLLLLEDLGEEPVVAGEPPTPIEERYAAAVDVLLLLHEQPLPAVLPVTPQLSYALPRYDMEAFLIEAELLLDWYLPRMNVAVSSAMRADYAAAWRVCLRPAVEEEPTWVLRDFHSPNLLWLAARNGVARVGLLDFQDAVIGPKAYDLASLLQDARVDVPQAMEEKLFQRYVDRRSARAAQFDAAAFGAIYATLAAQRASKVLGIFARLDRRDGKPHYLCHLPRVWRYLQRALAHPVLARLCDWYRAHVPAPQP